MSAAPKVFLINPVTTANRLTHELHTVTVKRSGVSFVYRWQCCCGVTHPHVARWTRGPIAEANYTAHSGNRLTQWPPLDQATLVVPEPRTNQPRKKAHHV